MNKDIMSYCGDGILDAADKYWERSKNKPLLRRIAVICAAALFSAGMIAAAFVIVSKINIPKPTLPPDTEATSPVYSVSDDETEAGVSANDGTESNTEEEGEKTSADTTAGVTANVPEMTEEEGAATSADTSDNVPEATEKNDTAEYTYASIEERPTKTFVNYGDYLDFLAESDHNSKIIEYEKLKAIGKFRSFVLLSDDFSQYKYAFDDGSGFTVNLTVTDKAVRKDPTNYEIIDPSDYGTDLRALRSDASGTRHIGDIEYMYVNGKLLWISWEEGGIRFTLSGNSTLDGYPHGVNTFTARLMDEKTAAEGIRALQTGG